MKRFFILMIAAMLIFSCKKNVLAPVSNNYILDQKAANIHYNQFDQFLVMENKDSIPSSKIVWKVSDTTIGKIDENGLFKAKKIGLDTITATGQDFKLTSLVNVSSFYQLFQEPYAVIGTDTNTVKAKETRQFAGKDESTITGEDRILLSYKGENINVTSVTYTFVNGKLVGAIVYLTGKNDFNFIPKLMTFYSERYPLADVSSTTNEDFYGPYFKSDYEYIIVNADNLNSIKISY